MPPYMPEGWQWTDAFTSRLVNSVHAVSSSLVCLPEVDEGGPGPRLESWAFAVTAEGLQALLQEGLFELRTCKLCPCVRGSRKMGRRVLGRRGRGRSGIA